jgi:elongation factor Ts
MEISKDLIQKLREQTGAGIMDVKNAVQEANGDEEKVLELLRKRGQKIAAKKQAEREAKEGIIEAYVHGNNKTATLVQLTCETDFVAKNEEFKGLAHDIAMQVAAMDPQYLSPDKVPADILEKEKEIIKEQLKNENKPEDMLDKIVEGKLNKFYEENCLLNQKFIKDDKVTINDLITEKIAKLGEKIEIRKIARISF